MADTSQLCSVWLGSETGILKGVSLLKKQAFNFCNTRHLSRDQEVKALCWGDEAESELLVGHVDGTVKTFSIEKGTFTETRSCGAHGDGCYAGLARSGDALVTCTEQGMIKVWRDESTEAVTEINAGNNVCRMRQDPLHRNKMATGGKENGLKLWDLEKPESPTFSAKNLRDDWLDLRRPHWLRDVAFIPGTERVVTCTGYHQVHVFDPSSPTRRPVLEAEYGEYPLTALSLSPDGNTVVVGNTHGQIAMLDLRKGLVRGVLKGLAGGVRSLQCHPTQNVMASCGLDRFLRIHSLDDRKVQHRVYLKSRLNCLLLDSKDMELGGAGGKEKEGGGVKVEGDEEEEDEVWASMETVTEKSKRKTTEGEKDGEKEEQVKKAKKNEGED